MSDSYLCSAQAARVCSWVGFSLMCPCAIPTCASHRILVDARGWGVLPWAHARPLPVQRTGCSWMLVDGVLYNGPMSDPYLCSAQGARGCSWMGCSPMGHERFMPVQCTRCSCIPWMGCSPMDPCAISACSANMMLVDARGWGVPPWTHAQSLPVQLTGCSWMLVDGVLSHGPHERSPPVQRTGCSWLLVDGVLYHGPMRDPYLCNAQDARGCSWMGCSPLDP